MAEDHAEMDPHLCCHGRCDKATFGPLNLTQRKPSWSDLDKEAEAGAAIFFGGGGSGSCVKLLGFVKKVWGSYLSALRCLRSSGTLWYGCVRSGGTCHKRMGEVESEKLKTKRWILLWTECTIACSFLQHRCARCSNLVPLFQYLPQSTSLSCQSEIRSESTGTKEPHCQLFSKAHQDSFLSLQNALTSTRALYHRQGRATPREQFTSTHVGDNWQIV